MAFEHNPGLAALHAAIQAQNARKNEGQKVNEAEVEEIAKEIDEEKKTRRSRRRVRKPS